jgi:hypothetical protein
LKFLQVSLILLGGDVFSHTPDFCWFSDKHVARTAHSPSKAHNRADKRVFAKLCFVVVAELVKFMIVVVA